MAPAGALLVAGLCISSVAWSDVSRNAAYPRRSSPVSNSGQPQLQPWAALRARLESHVPSPNVLTPASVTAGPKILYAPAEDDDPVFRARIAARTGATVDYFNARTGTPSAALLVGYDAVYTWVNAPYAAAATFGDRLADYVDTGKTVILGPYCTYQLGNALGGRIMTSGYSPVYSPSGDVDYNFGAYAHDGTGCLYQGLLSFGSYARDSLKVLGAGKVDGRYRDGLIAIAYRPDMRVIYINGTGVVQIDDSVSEDYAMLVGNAFRCSRPAASPPAYALYGSNRAGQLFSIDVSSGKGTYVGDLPTLPNGRGATEIEFNKPTGRAYLQSSDSVNVIQPFDPLSGISAGSAQSDGRLFTGLEFVDSTLYGTSVTSPPPARSGSNLLMAAAEDDDSTYRAGISTRMGGQPVDYVDARAGTPTLAQLQAYDAIYTWADFSYLNNVLFGDRLADYVDAGGKVILGVFCTYRSGNYLDGRIMMPGYSPVSSPGGNHKLLSSYGGGGTSCIHAGVAGGSYADVFRDSLALRAGNTFDGKYTDNEIAHAFRNDMRVIYSNGSGNSQLGGQPGWDRVVANAAQCAPTQPGSQLRILDPATGSSTLVGSTGVGPIVGLAYRASSTTLFGITGYEGRHSRLVKLNRTTGAATVVGDAGFEAGSLEFASNGILYAGGAGLDGGNLYRIDLATGAGTLVGPTQFGSVTGLMRVEIGTTDVPAGTGASDLELSAISPNPATAGFRVWFTLPRSGPATLELVDIAGRRVERREVGSMGAGRHTVDMGRTRRLAPGVYLVRLAQGAGVQSKKVTVLF